MNRSTSGALALAVTHDPAPSAEPVTPLAVVEDFDAIVALCESRREPILLSHLTHDVQLVNFARTSGVAQLMLHPVRHIPSDIPARLQRRLKEWTGESWSIALVEESGAPTLAEQRARAKAQAIAYAASHPRVQELLAQFEGAEVIDIEMKDKES
jgi:DNA polymerase-3 subunit gamma/tau